MRAEWQTLALIGLGSNLGDRKAILDGAVQALRETPEINVQAVSPYHETKPVGGPSGQGRFLNAAAALETNLDPFGLLQVLQETESRFGRLRFVRWDERTLDLDLLLFGTEIVDNDELLVPHPRMALRRFVLAPLAEIAPDAVEPWTGRTVRSLLTNLDRRPSYLALDGPHDDLTQVVFRGVSSRLDAVQISKCGTVKRSPSSADPISKRFEVFQSLARKLDFSESSVSWIGDRWLLSDFCLPTEAIWLRVAYTANWPGEGAPFDSSRKEVQRCLGILDDLTEKALPPTFAVLLSGSAERVDRRSTAGVFSVPVLCPEAPQMVGCVDEILVSCAATRT